MKATKKILALATICTVLTVSAPVYAETIPTKAKDLGVVSTQMVNPVYSINVNGEYIKNAHVYVSEDRVMIPLRQVFERLGFKVNWNDKTKMIALEKMPVYITLFAGADGYTFAKTAPLKLGKAPEIINGVTYVPVEIMSEILKAELKVQTNGAISISYPEKAPLPFVKANISSVANTTVTITDPQRGEVVLNVNAATVIEDKDGKAVKIDALKKGMSIEVQYSPIMTASMPAQNSPVKIKISQPAAPEESSAIELNCQVTGINNNQITVAPSGAESTGYNSVVLNVSGDTKITDAKGQTVLLRDIKIGMKLTVKHSRAMTMSIPPQTHALEITVQ